MHVLKERTHSTDVLDKIGIEFELVYQCDILCVPFFTMRVCDLQDGLNGIEDGYRPFLKKNSYVHLYSKCNRVLRTLAIDVFCAKPVPRSIFWSKAICRSSAGLTTLKYLQVIDCKGLTDIIRILVDFPSHFRYPARLAHAINVVERLTDFTYCSAHSSESISGNGIFLLLKALRDLERYLPFFYER